MWKSQKEKKRNIYTSSPRSPRVPLSPLLPSSPCSIRLICLFDYTLYARRIEEQYYYLFKRFMVSDWLTAN